LIAPFFVTGCATPHTHFDWELAGTDTPTQRPAVVRHVAATQPRCSCDTVPVPAARPTPTWYQQSVKPVNNAVEQHNLPPVATNASFVWPVHGRVLSEFGSGAGGERNDGINISVTEGTPIRAAADGIVSYSGSELKSYGNLALIRHDNGYVTAYAHAEQFVVSKGDHVARGQVIGYAGQSGDVSAPQLHFEVRRGARDPVDPRTMLPSLQVASR
jgi:murein DD-endopeptidase MepM/ murein hydrolase activator NlpD